MLPPGAASLRKERQTTSGIPWASPLEKGAWSRENAAASRADVKGKDGDTEQTNSRAPCTTEKNRS